MIEVTLESGRVITLTSPALVAPIAKTHFPWENADTYAGTFDLETDNQ